MADQENIGLLIALGCLAFSLFIGAFILFVVKYQRRIFIKDMEIRSLEFSKQLELFKAKSEAEENEKERISRNLHDEINPLLIVLKLNLQRHRFDLLKDKFDPESFKADFEIIDRAIEGIRNSSYDLVPTFMLEYGLIKSLEYHMRSVNDAGTILATFTNYLGGITELPFTRQEQLNIYRSTLEIINNVLKHSDCFVIHVVVSSARNGLKIEVRHNGKGIETREVNSLAEGGGLGLKSLKARILILNAEIDYLKGKEWSSVKLTIPFVK